MEEINAKVAQAQNWAGRQKKWWNVRDQTHSGLKLNYIWHMRQLMFSIGYVGLVAGCFDLFFKTEFFESIKQKQASVKRFDPYAAENEKYFVGSDGKRVSPMEARNRWKLEQPGFNNRDLERQKEEAEAKAQSERISKIVSSILSLDFLKSRKGGENRIGDGSDGSDSGDSDDMIGQWLSPFNVFFEKANVWAMEQVLLFDSFWMPIYESKILPIELDFAAASGDVQTNDSDVGTLESADDQLNKIFKGYVYRGLKNFKGTVDSIFSFGFGASDGTADTSVNVDPKDKKE